VPAGVPAPTLPGIALSDLNVLLPLAVACFLLGGVETAAIGRMFTAKHGGRLDANREFLALGVANLGAALGHGFPVSGGMSQSLVNEGGGARTPLSGAIAAAVILLVVLFLSPLLRALPQPVLAAVVLVAVAGLFNVAALRELWHADRPEFVVAVAALLGVMGSGLLRGVLIGALISIVLVARAASRPHVAVLGRIPGTRRFSDRERHADNEPVPGVLVVRPESGLIYFNVDHACEAIVDGVHAGPERPRSLVLDLSAVPRIDLQAAHALATMARTLRAEGIAVQAVEARAVVRDRLRAVGADGPLGGLSRLDSVADAVDEALGRSA
jgi:MFS superfamily sulfate permease-like transporter